MKKADIKILITGGHLTPAMAVIAELKKRGYSNFIWVGHKYNQAGNKELSPEFTTVGLQQIPFIELRTGKLIRSLSLGTLPQVIKQFLLIPWGLLKSYYIIMRYRPQLILSFGGYLAVPVVIWGKIFGTKVITHEQTIVTGLANRIIGKFADKVLISWESSRKYFAPSKTILTGNPIRRDIFFVKSNNLTKDFHKELPTLLIYAGNQGSHEINSRVFIFVEKLLEDCNVIHQTGNSSVTNDFKAAQELKNKLPAHLKYRYLVKDYILPDEVGEALNKSNLILGRAGANTITEILALGKLAILIPIPWASHNEQFRNAEFVANTGLGYIIKQNENLTAEKIYQTILLSFNQLKNHQGFNNNSLDDCIEKAKASIILDAPTKVSDIVENLVLTTRNS